MNRIRYLLISAVLAITSVISTQKSFAQQKFWLDGRMVEAQASTSGQATIDISTLSSGLHWLTITTKDEAGVWSAPMTKTFIVPYKSADGKSIVEHEYWIDGKMEASVKQNEQPSAIDVNTLAPGIHTLTIRIKDNTGLWSSQITKNFIVPVNQLDVADKKIVEHQYWIDDKMEASVKQNEQPSTIDIATLTPGIHSLNVRVKDNTGMWSSQLTRFFIVPEIDVADKSIVEHQYWIDGKMQTSVTQNEKPSIINISTLKPGLHSLAVRTKDNTGMWSSQATRYFVLDGDAMKETTITHCMYWFDDDLAKAKTMMLDAESGAVNIDISEVEAGTHTLWWRCGDSNGALSVPCSVSFESSSYYNYTVPESGIGTYSAKYNITLPDGLKAYFCTKPEAGDDGLVFNLLKVDGNIINGGTGVLLCGTPGKSYRMYPTEEEGAATEGNSLVAVTESADIAGVEGDYINYMLQNWQFDKIADNATMPANSAYLSLPAAEVGDASTILVNDPEKITQDEDGYYLIGTARHWIDFAKIVETNESANAKMIADVDLGDSQVHIGPQDNTAYKGIFDGQGHTLTVAYVGKSNEVVAPFTRVQGATIKNLHVAGSIKSVFAYIGVVGIVVGPGKTTISNVWNSATMEINSGSWVQSGAILGGFKSSGNVEISDCLFTGTFTSSYGYYSGCFVGYNYESGLISVNNCLSTGTFNMSGPSFHGNYDNCYVTSFPASYPSGVKKPTNEELNNGTIATSLQANRVEEIWIQDPVLGVPRLKSFDKGISYTVPSSGIGTFSAKGHTILPEGLKAYYCKAYDQQENTIGLVAISGNIVPAETGVVLVGNSGETFTLTGTCGETPEITNNELVAVTDSRHVNATDGDYTNFMMKGGKFVRIKESTNSMMPANRAYLPLSTALITDSNAKMITLRWDDETTGIKTTGDNDRMRNGVIYNLNGQKLSAPRKGINIINGRKVIVK
ncbi:MAG: hypothetical protein MR645_07110 [Paraprevotella sp.]|nr:hypothetical protein [Paraprevotella sp.]